MTGPRAAINFAYPPWKKKKNGSWPEEAADPFKVHAHMVSPSARREKILCKECAWRECFCLRLAQRRKFRYWITHVSFFVSFPQPGNWVPTHSFDPVIIHKLRTCKWSNEGAQVNRKEELLSLGEWKSKFSTLTSGGFRIWYPWEFHFQRNSFSSGYL